MSAPRSDPTVADIFDETARPEAEAIYCKVVDDMFDSAEDYVISNGKPEHAAYLIYKFLRNARSSISLFSGSLEQVKDGVPIYRDPHILDAARLFLRRSGSRLRVVLQDTIDASSAEEHPLADAILRDSKAQQTRGSLEIRQASPAVVDGLKRGKFLYHFLVMDGRAHRVETDPDKPEAFANFGDRSYAEALEQLFNGIWAVSTPVWRLAR